ncbi:MAG: RloB domain-containing protein, partial [Tannerella sp.]|nr:RloB domain-containing protein [Tannerella sp.]
DDYKKAIEDAVNKKKKDKKSPFKYKKNATDMYDILQQYGNQEQAIKNAEQLSQQYEDERFATHNPRTQVYDLVKQLIGKDEVLNEEIKKKFK